MIYLSFNLSLLLSSGLRKTCSDQAHRAVHVHPGQANSTLTRPRSPIIGRCPSDSGFLAGRVRVGPGSAGRAAKSTMHYLKRKLMLRLKKKTYNNLKRKNMLNLRRKNMLNLRRKKNMIKKSLFSSSRAEGT